MKARSLLGIGNIKRTVKAARGDDLQRPSETRISSGISADIEKLFKILVIQATNDLSDERAEFLINDRLSFMRFLGLGLEDSLN
jgi:hypothetical protein